MATKKAAKKAAPKKAAKKAAPKKAAAPAGSPKVSFALDAKSLAKAAACIKKSGKVTFGIKEITVSKLPIGKLSSLIILD
jgi:hypothetical protein